MLSFLKVIKNIFYEEFFDKFNKRTFIIAELSANHNGSIETAIETIKAVKRSGADAIKLQTYTADTITLSVKSDDFLITIMTIWDGKYLHDLPRSLYSMAMA